VLFLFSIGSDAGEVSQSPLSLLVRLVSNLSFFFCDPGFVFFLRPFALAPSEELIDLSEHFLCPQAAISRSRFLVTALGDPDSRVFPFFLQVLAGRRFPSALNA